MFAQTLPFALLLLLQPSSGPSQQPEQASALATPEEPVEAEELRIRAERLVSLMRGELALDVDPRTLLTVDLAAVSEVGERGQRLAGLLRALEATKATQSDREKGPESAKIVELEGLDPESAWETAAVAFLSLSPARRAELIATHEQRRAAQRAEARAGELLAALVSKTRAQADGLEAFLEERLDSSVDPSGLLRVDLLDSDELGLSPGRRSSWLEPDQTVGPEGEAGDAAPSDELARARERLDALRRRYVALSLEEKAHLKASHQRRVEEASAPKETPAPEADDGEEEVDDEISTAEAEATEAAAAREAALEAARRAKTEAKRILAEEHARLLGVKEAQARFAAELKRRQAERPAARETVLEWSRRIGDLERSPKFASEKAIEADPMYESLRSDLSQLRIGLRDELRMIRAGSRAPVIGEGLDRGLPATVDRGELTALRGELERAEQTLRDLERSINWEIAEELRDDLVTLNRTRLALLEMASPALRRSVTGFGPAGVDQLGRELDQITIELSFHFQKIGRYREDAISALQGLTIPLLIGVIQLLLAISAFVWWRKRGSVLLDRSYQHLNGRRPFTRVHAMGATLLWYLLRVRRPLEDLVLLWVLLKYVVDPETVPEFQLLWIVAAWVLSGLAVISFVDALAAREQRFSTATRDSSALRMHSLRVVGLNVIAVGLILSLTSAMVGHGAIFHWVISTCWFLSFPVALYLIYRWRPVILERVEQRREKSAYSRWVISHKTGPASFVAVATAAGFLLALGFASWLMRQLSGLETTRRLLAYLFRREVARQAAATEADHRFTPVDSKIRALFDANAIPIELFSRVARDELSQVIRLASTPRPTLSVVVGERGSGKSLFLKCVAAAVRQDAVQIIKCPEDGLEVLLDRIAKVAGDASLRGPALGEALRAMSPVVLAIDDVQRLVIPAVNGLAGLDRLTAFARQVGGEVSWIMTIDAASWHYVRRARGERVFFEQVVATPTWSEEQLGELIRACCERAAVRPSFDELIVPRQADAPLPSEGNRNEVGYYRLLWDYSNGNPSLALHAFRESLYVAPDGHVVVRLFKEPEADELEELPLSLLFVLRAVIQLELARPDEIEAATQLPLPDIEDALRFCVARGYLDKHDGGVRMSLSWYRTATRVLQRQHLLSAQ